MPGKDSGSLFKRRGMEERDFYCHENWRGDWVFIQADSGMAKTADPGHRNNLDRPELGWVEALRGQRRYQSCSVSLYACKAVPQFLHRPCNPAIKSESRNVGSQLTNERESMP